MKATPSAESPTSGGRNLLQTLDYSVLQQCMHCGLCLPSCPTYAETGRERHSPRGRIALMRAVADGELGTTREFAEEMSYCLGCLACTTACPAAVDYTTLLETARAQVEVSGIMASPGRRLLRRLTLGWLFTHPRALRTAARALRFWQTAKFAVFMRRIGLMRLLPRRLAALESAAPRIRHAFSDELIPEVSPARGPRRYRVALLTGCVQDIAFSEVNRATAEVLTVNGCEVVTPRTQFCCGSIHAHNGDPETARQLARRQIDLIDPCAFDAIISNAAGCGSHLKHYDRLLADDPRYAARSAMWVKKVKDISEWLVEIEFRPPENGAAPLHVATYHDACHLCHAQKITAQPRQLLQSLPGLELHECTEANWCCGSAGIYALTQPLTAASLLARKLGHLAATEASIVATANPGCQLHLENGLQALGRKTRVVHPVVLLAEAYAEETQADPGRLP